MSEQKEHRIEVNWVQSTAGALAAMSSAILLSTVGVAGTIIGAAIGSLFATVGSAVYSYYLRTSRARAAAAAQAAREAGARARARRQSASSSSTAGSTSVRETEAAAEDEPRGDETLRVESSETPNASKPTWQEVVRGLDWKRIGLVALGLFAVVMGVILTLELIAGRSVSSYTGGSDEDRRTSVSWGGGNDDTEQQDQDQDQDQDQEQGDEDVTPDGTPEDEPTTDVTTPAPEQDAPDAPDEEEPAPTEAPTTTAPESPTEEEPAPIEPPDEPTS